jgi:hypothetical protein
MQPRARLLRLFSASSVEGARNMPTRARSGISAAIDGAAFGLATIALTILVLWWMLMP